jgi:aminoglycoside phosphotransferase (APT) family kinase protein
MTSTALDLAAVRGFLHELGVPVVGELKASLIAGGRSNLTYKVVDDVSKWVLRRPPTAGLTPSAHDVAREFRVTAALADTGVPVAKPVALCEDLTVLGAPFTVAEHVDGKVFRTKQDLDELADNEVEASVEELLRVLVALHDVDYERAGLDKFGRPEGYVDRQIARWSSQWDRVKLGESNDVDRLVATLRERVPAHSSAAIVHGDYRIDNTMLAPDDASIVRAVVDWELSTLGDPLTDVAMLCVYRNPAFDLVVGEPAACASDRLPSAQTLAERYAVKAGRDLGDWGFYLAMANLKVAVIAAGIDHRFRMGAARGQGFDSSGAAVPEFIAAGLASLTPAWI